MWTVMQGSAREIPLKDKSVQCVVTSPPYWGLRDYGVAGQIGLEKTPAEYVDNIVAVFREVKRVLRDDGTCWVNLGDSYFSHDPGGYREGEFLNPDGRPPLKGQARNRAGNYVEGAKRKDLVGIPWRVAFALQADGWYLRSDIIWSKPNPMPESVTDRPTKAHEYIFLLSKKERYFFDQDAVREPAIPDSRDKLWGTTNGSRHDHENDRERGMQQYKTQAEGFVRMSHPLGRNIRTVWEIATQPFPEAHFATFPEELAERCIKAGSRVGDVVLDPFGGAGTTALVADKLNRRGVGLELKLDYCRMAHRRCFDDAPLFGGAR